MISTALACSTLLCAAATALADGAPSGGEVRAGGAAGEAQLSRLNADEQVAMPAGSPEDQARWKAAHEVNQQVAIELSLSSRLQWTGRTRQYAERLEALAGRKDAPEAGRAAELLARYRKVTLENWFTATRQWPVDKTRACQYPLLDLQSAMQPSDAPRRGVTLIVAREGIDDCVAKARAAVKVLAGSNADLEGLHGAAEALLPAQGSGAPEAPAARTPDATSPAAPAATR